MAERTPPDSGTIVPGRAMGDDDATMTDFPAPQSRRERPAKPALSRRAIVDAARALLTEEGLERVTMRRIATTLDTGAASLYVYVRNTEELHAAVLDELLADVDVPRSGSWRERLVELLVSYTEVLYAHPSLARMAVTTRPSGPHSLRLFDTLLGLLAEGGVPVQDAAWAVDLLVQHATVNAAEAGTRGNTPESELEDATLVAAVRTAASDGAHPHLAEASDHLFSGTGAGRLRWSFNLLLNGILATPVPADQGTGD
jgi:AcrR family transcriptional regulator